MNLIKEQLQEFQAVATDDGNEAVRLCEECSPVLLIADIPLHGISGLKAAAQVNCPVLIVTERFEARYVLPALRCGVKGYISKAEEERLPEIIRTVAGGGCAYDKRVTEMSSAGCSVKPLSENDKQLLRWIVRGYKEEKIAKILGCNVAKAHNLCTLLTYNLRCKTRTQAVFNALRLGYMDFRDFY